MKHNDPTVPLIATLLGLLLMVPFVWLPEWTMGFGMAFTVGCYTVMAYRKRIRFSLLEMVCIVVFWPVALALPVSMRVRSWHRRGHYLRFGS